MKANTNTEMFDEICTNACAYMCVLPFDECAYVFVLLGACLWEEEREKTFSHIYLYNSGD